MRRYTQVADGVRRGLASTAAGATQLDIIGFDACLMAQNSVSVTLAPLAHYLLASQELEPGHGWDYNSLRAAAQAGRCWLTPLTPG